MLVLGLGGAAISIVSGDLSVTISGMSLAAIVGILLNLLLPDEKVNTEEPKQPEETKELTTKKSEEKNEEEIKNEEKNDNTKVIAETISETKIEGKKMNINVLDNPIIEHKLSIIRNKNTGTKEFRELITEIAIFLCYEAMKDAKLKEVEIETPLCKTNARVLEEDNYAFVPILRAGTGMLDGLLQVIPNAKIGHIGLYRNEETLEPVKYYYKMPKDISNREVLILDPMLATGGSAADTIKCLKEDGVKKIKFLSIISAPEGIKKLNEEYPDVELYTAAIDEKLNEHGYILPGLGDAGDRIFGTK